MQLLRIDHNADLKRLRDEGYEVEVIGGHILVHHIPYVNNAKKIAYGTLVSHLNQSSGKTLRPNDHVMLFIGDHPCNQDGSIMTGIQHGSANQTIAEGITVNHSFSNKPPAGYNDYYEKFSRYADMISAPAISLDAGVTAKTFRAIPENDTESVFNYLDTNASRANIQAISSKFKGQKIAIIGMGGTGAYILDQVAKTPVAEIHMYDGDLFLQHNAFRSPGAASLEQLDGSLTKVAYYYEIYSKMHRHIVAHEYFIDESNFQELTSYDYVFVCIDRNRIRLAVIAFLVKNNVSCIDVGLGVNVADDNLVGTVRVTLGTLRKHDHIKMRISASDEEVENEYNTNIQIAELNGLNAMLAVIKWKKLTGFYQDVKEEHHTTYSINVSQLLNEDTAA